MTTGTSDKATPCLDSPQPVEPHSSGHDLVALTFCEFTVQPNTRTLYKAGRSVDIGSRAFDLLYVLLRSRGRVVTKSEIYKYVWPSSIVEESNLRFQIAGLRDILGERGCLLKTVRGRGYLLAQQDPEPMQVIASATSTQETSGNDHSTATVMIVDDDDDAREALCGLIRSAGFHAVGFASVDAFLRDGLYANPDCVVLDVWLRGTNGLELQVALRRVKSELPVIFISGHADVHTTVTAMKGGAIEFLEKPVRHQDLLNAIQSGVSAGRRLGSF